MQPATPHLGEIGAPPVVEPVRSVGRSDEVAQRRVGERLVHQDAQGRQLLGPAETPARRHHGGGIPVEDGERLLQRGDAAEAGLEGRVRRHGAASGFRRW